MELSWRSIPRPHCHAPTPRLLSDLGETNEPPSRGSNRSLPDARAPATHPARDASKGGGGHLGGVDPNLAAREEAVGVGVDERERGAEDVGHLGLEPVPGAVVEGLPRALGSCKHREMRREHREWTRQAK